MGSPVRTRIAPTPSGWLHAGNAINFLVTHKLVRAQGGSLLLRIDDLDTDRARPEYIADSFDSLMWLGIAWDEGPLDAEELTRTWSQTLRVERYRELLNALRDAGHLFACACSRARLNSCACRDRAIHFDALDVAWRLRVPDPCPVRINSSFSDARTIDLHQAMRDPVLRQRNGSPAYQIASLADDVDFRIDLIVRGEDLLPSTACQMYLARLLGFDAFQQARFVHHPLVMDARGAKLSKSTGAFSLKTMRKAGLSPDELHARADAMMSAITPPAT